MIRTLTRELTSSDLAGMVDTTCRIMQDRSLTDVDKAGKFIIDVLHSAVSKRTVYMLMSMYAHEQPAGSGWKPGLKTLLGATDEELHKIRQFGKVHLHEIRPLLDYINANIAERGNQLDPLGSEPARDPSIATKVTERLDTAVALLRGRKISDPHGHVLTELLRQLSETK